MTIDYPIYKGQAAAQFKLIEPKIIRNEEGWVQQAESKAGAVLVTVAPSSGERKYDFSQKIMFALKADELTELMLALKTGGNISLIHDTNAGNKALMGKNVKRLSLSPAKDKKTLFLNLSHKVDDEETKVPGIPISKNEAMTLCLLFDAAVPRIFGW